MVRLANVYSASVWQAKGFIYLTNMGTALQSDIFSSSLAPYERKLYESDNSLDETGWVAAENSVCHGGRNPSHIVLPMCRTEQRSSNQQLPWINCASDPT